MELGLQGKVALITGASRGIGQGIAMSLAEEGCDVLITGRDEAGRRIELSVYGRDASDARVLAKVWRFCFYRDSGPTLILDRLQQVEHEAYLTLMAARAGAGVPDLLAAGRFGPSRDAALITRLPDGPALAEADSADDLDPTRAGGPAGYRLADRAALLAGISAAVGDGTSGVSALVGAKDADTMQRLVAAQEEADEAVAALPDSSWRATSSTSVSPVSSGTSP